MARFRVFTDDEGFGRAELLLTPPGAFREESERVGVLLASRATVTLSAARTGRARVRPTRVRADKAYASRKNCG
ncbi:hypothetical protein YW3DRAFT_07120 [Streptomyces sp. MnatMP-M77]|nr:hypothetical protein YW3DRAFT_07120 [Streptomyces sp. MnatMP-M77]